MSERVKPKVLHLIKSLGRGGAETLLVETLAVSARDRFDFVYAYFLPWKNQLVKPLEEQGVEVKCFSASNNILLLLQWRKVLRFVRREKVDLIHCHLPWAGLLGRIVGKLAGIPVVYTEHNKQERYHFLTRWINQATLRWNTAVIAVSAEVGQSIQKFKGKDFPVVVVPNGVNVEKYSRDAALRESSRRELGLQPQHIVVGNICVFRVQKRLSTWIEIAQELVKQHPDVRFLLVGDGPLKAQIETQIAEAHLGDFIILPGLKPDVRPYLQAMDIFLLTSEFEGLPLALLEAMATGIPVAVTNAGGVDSVVQDGVNGLKVDVNAVRSLSARVNDLITGTAYRQRLGEQGRKTIVEKYGIDNMVSHIEDVYKQHLS